MIIPILIIAAHGIGQPVQSATDGSKYAFIVGIDSYDDSAIPSLTGAVNDARAVRDVLIKNCGFRAENITFLSSDASQKALRPTRLNILNASTLFQHTVINHHNPNDVVFMYYAGHAVNIGSAAFLIPMDAQMSVNRIQSNLGLDAPPPGNPPPATDPNGFHMEPDQMNLLAANVPFHMAALPVKAVIAGFDMCRSDGWDDSDTGKSRHVFTPALERDLDFSRAMPNSSESEGAKGPEIFVMNSCEEGKCSYESGGRGYFSTALEAALSSGQADYDNSGTITLEDLKKYLIKEVPKLSDGKQSPYFKQEGSDVETLPIATVGKHAPVIPQQEVAQEIKATETVTPEQARSLYAKGVWDMMPSQRWCDIVSGEGGFTIRIPLQIRPDRPVARTITPVDTKTKEGTTKTDMVSYYFDDQSGYAYYRFQASFADMPSTLYKDENQVLDWGEYLMKSPENKGLFGETDLDAFFRFFIKNINIGSLFGIKSDKPKDQVIKGDFKVGRFGGRRYIVRKADGDFTVVQLAAIKNRLYMFLENYQGGMQETLFPQGYFIASLNFDDTLLERPEEMIPVFDAGPAVGQ